MNVAQPLSSGSFRLGLPESHTLEPMSMAAHVVGSLELMGSSADPVENSSN